MQLKCPGCSRALKIPDSAAGKVVKCPCGKQLRVPQPSGAARPNPAPAATTRSAPTAASRPAAARPAASPAAAARTAAPSSAFGVDADLFDELTESDWKPVATIPQPGAASAGSGGANLSSTEAQLDRDKAARRKENESGSAKEVMSSIGILLLLGVLRLVFSIIFMMGVEAEAADLTTDPDFEGDASTVMMILRVIYGVNALIGLAFCVCAGLIFMFPMSCAITAMVLFVLGEILSMILNPFLLISIRGWIVRGAIFGGLIQCINNAAYYKFVKSGGRD